MSSKDLLLSSLDQQMMSDIHDDIDGYVDDLFATMANDCKPEKCPQQYEEICAGIEFDEDSFIWEDVKLSDGCLTQALSQSLSEPASQAEQVAKQEPLSPSVIFNNAVNIPDIDILQTAVNEIPASPNSSESSEVDTDTARYPAYALVIEYGLDDESLSDMSLKKLKDLCKGDEEHFTQLKSYRRTCLNRHYARSSRAKTQRKTICMSTELENAKQTITKLTKENNDKSAEIKYLQLELQILKSMSK